mmetsp:Transcript_37884/g.87564  ORF Transcript_37884/g.87564 Transcript_37884/m.87564 type:complete len:210 (-) Transcript_37884:2293-2922(-)
MLGYLPQPIQRAPMHKLQRGLSTSCLVYPVSLSANVYLREVAMGQAELYVGLDCSNPPGAHCLHCQCLCIDLWLTQLVSQLVTQVCTRHPDLLHLPLQHTVLTISTTAPPAENDRAQLSAVCASNSVEGQLIHGLYLPRKLLHLRIARHGFGCLVELPGWRQPRIIVFNTLLSQHLCLRFQSILLVVPLPHYSSSVLPLLVLRPSAPHD